MQVPLKKTTVNLYETQEVAGVFYITVKTIVEMSIGVTSTWEQNVMSRWPQHLLGESYNMPDWYCVAYYIFYICHFQIQEDG
jgi:hypothetical protein